MRLYLLRGIVFLLVLTGSTALAFHQATQSTDTQQRPGMTTPVRPGGSGGVVITYGPAQPQQPRQPQPRATATPAFVDVIITLPQPSVVTVINNALTDNVPRLLALLEGAQQRLRIFVAQRDLLAELTVDPINAVLLSRTTEGANTLTVRVPTGRVSFIQELSGIQSVTPVQPAPGDDLAVTPPANLTSRPVDQPGYPVITVEAR